MPAVQHWGRKESLLWPPRGNLYTLGAFLAALLATSLLLYTRYQWILSPLERYYLPYYLRSAALGQLHPTDVYQLLFVADRKSLRRAALDTDVEAGTTLQVRGRPLQLQ